MAWSASKIFMAWLEDTFENTAALDANADTFKAALYDNDITPDSQVATASSLYNAGQWTAAGNEVSDGTEWDAGGEPLTGFTCTRATNVLTIDATDTPSGGSSATLAAVFGCLVYDDTVGDQGLSFHYFGGSNSVTDGTFTVIWNAAGLLTITL